MKQSSTRFLILFLCAFLLLLGVYAINYIGYLITAICTICLLSIVVLVILEIKGIKKLVAKSVNRYSVAALVCIVALFLVFSIFYMKKTELIFFDEQIYQSIALNIVKHGNAELCLYGTAGLKNCYSNGLGYDPVGYPFIIALAFRFFGAGISTAYNLEILFGAFAIILVFLLASVLSGRKDIGVLSAVIFTLIPEFFIWAKTPANPNLPFTVFLLLTTFFFFLFMKIMDKKSLALFFSSLALTAYIRVEALLLIPLFLFVFLFFGSKEIKKTFRLRIGLLGRINSDTMLQVLLALFILAIIPEIYVIIITKPLLSANAGPFLSTNASLFSLQYLQNNILTNGSFLLGFVKIYPIIFLPAVTVFAIIGVLCLLVDKRKTKGLTALVFSLLLFIVYFIFYGLYFSGSVLLGGSVRFLLVIYPPLAIMAAFGISGSARYIYLIAKRISGDKINKNAVVALACTGIVAVFFVLPFLYAVPFLRNPNYNYTDFPLKLNGTTENSIYTMNYANRSLAFIDNNYDLVPNNCLVLSEAPYLWYTLNRSSVSLDLLNSSENIGIGNYSCYVLDYDYWCSYPIGAAECNSSLGKYDLRVLANENNGNLPNFTLYQIMNLTNSTKR
jgi:hypothetical protein